jgi:hypothetical protein
MGQWPLPKTNPRVLSTVHLSLCASFVLCFFPRKLCSFRVSAGSRFQHCFFWHLALNETVFIA